jgi:uncharacterized phage-associated protein
MDARPAAAADVAAAIIERAHDVDQMKLHKLLYYAQAWNLAWYGIPMFEARIEAWQHGPYVPRVGRVYSQQNLGYATIKIPVEGDPTRIDPERAMVLDSVIVAYDELSGSDLARLIKSEGPWHEARGGRSDDDPTGRDEITPKSLRTYYQRENSYGAKPPEVSINADTLARAHDGDRGAVVDALNEALAG